MFVMTPQSSIAIAATSATVKSTHQPHARTLREFTLFARLPTEVQAMVWYFTLKPRVVELLYHKLRGFYTTVPLPVALYINTTSRSTMLSHYQLAFGNIMHPAQVRFNFRLDTLYLPEEIQDHIFHLFASMKEDECKKLRYMAISEFLHEDIQGYSMIDSISSALNRILPHMPEVKQIEIVHPLILGFVGASGYDEHRTPLRFYRSFPPDFELDCKCFEEWLEENECGALDCEGECTENLSWDGCQCYYDPVVPPLWADSIKGCKLSSVWGWRPNL